MGESPLISICIPAYQRTDYLKRLLVSISIQLFRNFEVIITDDSPGDEVKNLVRSHPLGSKIFYFKNKIRLGSPENWNEGLRLARGEWIKPMHDDDWFSGPDSLGAFARAAQYPDVSFFYSAYINILPDGNRVLVRNPAFTAGLNRNPEILIAANRVGPPSCVIFKKDENLLFDTRLQWLVDIDFYIRYLKTYPAAQYIPVPLIHIGISASQVTKSSFGKAEIEIPERFLLWEKMNGQHLNNILIYDSWWRFVRNMRIDNEQKITGSGYFGTVPPVIRKMIRVQRKIPKALLNTGMFSKFFMGIQFILRKKTIKS